MSRPERTRSIRRIHITQEDIDQGVPLDAHQCAVALAIKRVFKMDYLSGHVQVGYASGSIRLPNPKFSSGANWYRFDMDEDGIAWHIASGTGMTVHPTTIILTIDMRD